MQYMMAVFPFTSTTKKDGIFEYLNLFTILGNAHHVRYLQQIIGR